MNGRDGKLYLSEKEIDKVWEDYVKSIMNEEDDWDHNVELDAAVGPLVCVCREEVIYMMQWTNEVMIIMTMMIIFKSYFSREHIALSLQINKKRC